MMYSTWILIDHNLVEDTEDYWHMKYIASDKIGKYNYAVLIKYKWIGFITKYSSSIFVVGLLISVSALIISILKQTKN